MNRLLLFLSVGLVVAGCQGQPATGAHDAYAQVDVGAVASEAFPVTVRTSSTTGAAFVRVRVEGLIATRQTTGEWKVNVPADLLRVEDGALWAWSDVCPIDEIADPPDRVWTAADREVDVVAVAETFDGNCVIATAPVTVDPRQERLAGVLDLALTVPGEEGAVVIPRTKGITNVTAAVTTTNAADAGLDFTLEVTGGTPTSSKLELSSGGPGTETTTSIAPSSTTEAYLVATATVTATGDRAVETLAFADAPVVLFPATFTAYEEDLGSGACGTEGNAVTVFAEAPLDRCRVSLSRPLRGLQVCSLEFDQDLVVDGVSTGWVARSPGAPARDDSANLYVDSPGDTESVVVSVECADMYGQTSTQTSKTLLPAESSSAVESLDLTVTGGFDAETVTYVPESEATLELELVATPATLAGADVTWAPDDVEPFGPDQLVGSGGKAVAMATWTGTSSKPFTLSATVNDRSVTRLVVPVEKPALAPGATTLPAGASVELVGVGAPYLLPWTCWAVWSASGAHDAASHDLFDSPAPMTFSAEPMLNLIAGTAHKADTTVTVTCEDAAGQASDPVTVKILAPVAAP